MYDIETMNKFIQQKDSIRLAYEIGVFSLEYAQNKMRRLYAETFGVCSAIYAEMAYNNFTECLE